MTASEPMKFSAAMSGRYDPDMSLGPVHRREWCDAGDSRLTKPGSEERAANGGGNRILKTKYSIVVKKRPNTQMEPARQTVSAIVRPRRAAHLQRSADKTVAIQRN